MSGVKKHIETEENEPCVSWRVYNEKKYLHVHFRGIDSMEYISNMMEMRKLMELEEDKSIRYFLDATGANFSFSTNLSLQKLSKSLQHKIHRSGFIGIQGNLLTLYKLYKSVTKSRSVLFTTQQEALDYICAD